MKLITVILSAAAVAGCCGELPATDAGPTVLRCVANDGTVAECAEGARCRHWECGPDASVCCPEGFPIGCQPGVCGESWTACESAGAVTCEWPAPCGISCEGEFPVACAVERPEGVVWTCAADETTCAAIPGEVCEG